MLNCFGRASDDETKSPTAELTFSPVDSIPLSHAAISAPSRVLLGATDLFTVTPPRFVRRAGLPSSMRAFLSETWPAASTRRSLTSSLTPRRLGQMSAKSERKCARAALPSGTAARQHVGCQDHLFQCMRYHFKHSRGRPYEPRRAEADMASQARHAVCAPLEKPRQRA